MNLLIFPSYSSIQLLKNKRLIVRTLVKVGDKVPINYIKDAPPILIKPDAEYPEWVLKLTEPLPTKEQLLSKYDKVGATGLSLYENNRLRRLIGRDAILDNNASNVEEEM